MLKNIFIATKKQLTKILITTSILMTCFACGGGGNSSASNADKISVSGTLTFDRVPITESGLNYNNISQVPIRRCKVSAIEVGTNKELATGYTNEQGSYSLTVEKNKTIAIQVYAESKDPVIQVKDNFTVDSNNSSEFALYTIESANQTLAEANVTIDINATSGWDASQNRLANDRMAAPFAILDSCLKATDFFLAKRQISFPDLEVVWSEKNTSSTIGTSNWNGTRISVLGDANQDTDEYDEHIIVHEWGHYFESAIARSDSMGGPHTDGDILEASLAFSEGWGNALSAMVLYPDSVYKDSGGLLQGQTGIMFDVDENNFELSLDPSFKIGWFSENSTQSILYDIFDPATDDTNESWDLLEADSSVFYDVFANGLKSSEPLVNIFSFIDQLQKQQVLNQPSIDTLLAKHEIEPVQDSLGSGENNDGGLPGTLPVYQTITAGQSIDLSFHLTKDENFAGNIRYIYLKDLDGTFSINTTGSFSKRLILTHKGVIKSEASGFSNTAITNFSFESNKEYVLLIVGNQKENTLTLTLSN